ncbi:MAG: PepSY-like domain-containing protein [Bacteroidaceae bacterium]|nr:PepSY-like domain-containing protein [Bacteroidaceae bacterium]
MKTKTKLLTLAFFALPPFLISCEDDKDKSSVVSDLVLKAFYERYPNSSPYDWDVEGAFYKAEFFKDDNRAEAWFTEHGTWIKTEVDYFDPLPELVQQYIQMHYADYRIDDVNWVETPTENYYEVELEKKGVPDMILKIGEDGQLLDGKM